MLLYSNKIKKIYSPCLVSVVQLAYFVVLGGPLPLATAPAWQVQLNRQVHSQKVLLNLYNPLSTHPMKACSRLMFISSCAVSCRTVTSCVGKLKAPAVGQKSFELERKCLKIFPSRPEKGTNGLLRCIGGKNRAANSNFGEKTASCSRSFQTAVSSLDFV